MITPAQCRMARAALAIGVRELAALADVSSMTVTRFENGRSAGYPETLQKVRSALESAGVIFVEENGDGPGVRLRKDVSAKMVSLDEKVADVRRGPERDVDQMGVDQDEVARDTKRSPKRALKQMKDAIAKDCERKR